MAEQLPPAYSSFLIRFLPQPARAGGKVIWQAEIEHVQSGDRQTFSAPDRMLGFLVEHAGSIPPLVNSEETLK